MACGLFLPTTASHLLCLSYLSFSLTKTPVMTSDPAASFPHLKILHHTCKALFCHVTLSQVLRVTAGMLSCHHSKFSVCSGPWNSHCMVPAGRTSPRGRKELAGLFPPWNPSLRTWVTHGKTSPKSLQLGWETFNWSPNQSNLINEEQNISASVLPLLPP